MSHASVHGMCQLQGQIIVILSVKAPQKTFGCIVGCIKCHLHLHLRDITVSNERVLPVSSPDHSTRRSLFSWYNL